MKAEDKVCIECGNPAYLAEGGFYYCPSCGRIAMPEELVYFPINDEEEPNVSED